MKYIKFIPINHSFERCIACGTVAVNSHKPCQKKIGKNECGCLVTISVSNDEAKRAFKK